MPRLTPDMGSRERVDALEDHLNLTAVTRGELAETRLYAQGAAHELGREWDALEGWEVCLRCQRDATQRDVDAAKREIRRDLADAA